MKSVLVYGDIGTEVDGNIIAERLYDMVANGEKDITVNINSYGGSVQQGISIFSAIINLNKNGANINTHIDGFAVSIASIIAIAGKRITMNDFAKWMVHDAFLGGTNGDDLSDKEKKMLENVNSMITAILSRRGIDREQVSGMMKEETWIDATKAKSLSLVDEVISTEVTEEATNVLNQDSYMSLKALLNRKDFEPTKKIMKDLLNKLGAADEASAINKVADLNAKIETLTAEKTELENKVTEKDTELKTLKDAAKEQMKETVNQVVDAAVESGKLLKDKAEDIKEKYAENLDGLNSMLAAIPEPKPAKVSDIFNAKKEDGKQETDAEAYERMMKDEPEALNTLKTSNPEKFEKMYNAWCQA